MSMTTTYVGLDVHKSTIQVALLVGSRSEYVEWSVVHDAKAAARLARRIRREAQGEIVCCYEAGPCGYGLARALEALGITCQVIAPSLIPRKPGERIKTDRRDARKLAHYLRSGDLTEVRPPTPEEEAVRDLVRARATAKADLNRYRNRLSKLLLRWGVRYEAGKTPWTQAHHRWLRARRFDNPVAQTVFDDALRVLEQHMERIRDLDEALETVAALAPYAEPVAHLRCFRGLDTVSALTLVAELHGVARFPTARELMAYLGLVPSEHSSGGPAGRRQGGITKAGNSHVRRILVEASWHARRRPTCSAALSKRRAGQPAWVIRIADQAQTRLHRKWWRLVHQGKPTPVATTAVARELAGFVWAVLYAEEAPA